MFLQTLDVVLGLTFVYLVLSLVCTSANEGIASLFALRARTLRDGVRALLEEGGDPATHRLWARLKDRKAAPVAGGAAASANRGEITAATMYDHALIRGLAKRGPLGGRAPSYIPSRTFVLALLDLVAPVEQRGAEPVIDIRDRLDTLPEQIGRPLRIMLAEAKGNLGRLQDDMERWFNDSMTRVSGVYKRKAQLISFGLALIVSFASNADTIKIVGTLSTTPALREALVAQAEAFARSDTSVLGPAASVTAAERPSPAARIEESITRLEALSIPLGWSGLPGSRGEAWTFARTHPGTVFRKLTGLLLTAFAVSLGAPFWFDILNKVVNIRGAGRAPEERPKPPEEKPPARGL
ncbi:MAG: hypothetical protein M3373_08595 [Gemmatimonadota bacterium]|nr:hypothetical protein [Gemmatimonadota bacterium]